MNGGPSIAIDAMGGDSGPAAMIAGAAKALKRDPSLRFVIYGDQAQVEADRLGVRLFDALKRRLHLRGFADDACIALRPDMLSQAFAHHRRLVDDEHSQR